MDNKLLGLYLKENDISISSAAKRCGVSPQCLTDFIWGGTKPRKAKLDQIEGAYGELLKDYEPVSNSEDDVRSARIRKIMAEQREKEKGKKMVKVGTGTWILK
jgi:hypothetical protein